MALFTSVEKLFRLVPAQSFGAVVALPEALNEIAKKRFVIFGEEHGQLPVINFQSQIIKRMLEVNPERKMNIVMEHFSFEMQHLLDQYAAGTMTLETLMLEYKNIGTEGHKIDLYAGVLEHALNSKGRVRLHGGFIPRTYASRLVKEGADAALAAAKEKNYLGADETCNGTAEHYDYFDSLISGRDLHDKDQKPGERFRRIFPAQIMKDAAMAWKVSRLLSDPKTDDDEMFVLIMGNGHMGYNHGVPERLFKLHPSVEGDCYRVIARCADDKLTFDLNGATRVFGDASKNAAELCFLYEVAENIDSVKAETAKAYNKVGGTAHIEGNLLLAKKVMGRLGYTTEEIEIAGTDAYNYQGVGTPHPLAKLQNGETVLDLGSGLGIDSIIAATRVGPTGQVTGLDLSKAEVAHANARAERRGLKHLSFVTGDMEKMKFEDNMFDAVISNGAFCLAPSKQAAFGEIFRVLKPGARMAICTSTIKKALGGETKWPICMRMFVHKDAIKPICEEIGFTDVFIDDSNSLMSFEDEEEDNAEVDPHTGKKVPPTKDKDRAKSAVHVGSAEFKHLANLDMNDICARVVVFGRKPL